MMIKWYEGLFYALLLWVLWIKVFPFVKLKTVHVHWKITQVCINIEVSSEMVNFSIWVKYSLDFLGIELGKKWTEISVYIKYNQLTAVVPGDYAHKRIYWFQ